MDELPVGRYGTIHYMSNNGSDVPLASYPVDEEAINLGRSDHNTCHIRLIDRWCSDIHCKLIFEEGKAFLVVLGQNGVVIDGSDFFPSGNEPSPTTVPLTNGSEWLIFKRRFIFQYPPKAERAKLLATPRPKSRKSLRMSMINAAHVWTPSVSRTQEESLRALRTPVSPFSGTDDVKITLVEGNPLHFAQNEEEIVVMENVDSPQSESEAPPPASPAKVPQTPGRRGPPSLHRQVLLMNSHRKHVKHVDEQEEREVEASVMLEEDSDEELEEDAASNPFLTKGRKQDTQAEQEKSLGSISSGSSLNAKSFRASLGAIGSVLPFGRPSGVVVHSPHQHEKVSDVGFIPSTEPNEADVSDKGPHTPSDKRSLGSFLTPQATRGDSRALPRQSMGTSSLHYVDVDNDLEQARRRLAELGPMGRPQVVKIAAEDDDTSKSRPVPRSAKKSRPSLADIPELSSPLPSSKTRIGTNSMTPIPEPTSMESRGDDEDGDIDSAVRLQRLMRTVENVARRESIRESRRGVPDPVDFYSIRTDPVSPTKLTTEADASKTNIPPSTIKSNASKNGRSDDTNHMLVDEQEGSSQADTAHDEAASTVESRPTRKGTKGGKSGTKSKVTEVKMEVDEPASMTGTVDQMAGTSMEDVEMEDVPKKKSRATRKAVKENAPSTRARGGKTTAKRSASRDDTTDDQVSSTAIEPEAATTSSRRIGRPRTAVVSKDQDEVSSTGSKSTASRTTRKPKATSRKTEANAADSIQEDGNDELDLISSDPPSRPSTRRKRVPQAESSVDQSEESQQPAKRTATRRAPTTRKAKTPTTATSSGLGKGSESDVPEAEPEPAPGKTRRTQKSVKETQEAEESIEVKPRRTARTKR